MNYIKISTNGKGLYSITNEIQSFILESSRLVNIFIQHTSASLVIQESADPTAKRDLETWLNRLVKEESFFTHTAEGSDDMSAHIKSALTCTSLNIPCANGEMLLGRWQGVYLWEHRKANHVRSVVITQL